MLLVSSSLLEPPGHHRHSLIGCRWWQMPRGAWRSGGSEASSREKPRKIRLFCEEIAYDRFMMTCTSTCGDMCTVEYGLNFCSWLPPRRCSMFAVLPHSDQESNAGRWNHHCAELDLTLLVTRACQQWSRHKAQTQVHR